MCIRDSLHEDAIDLEKVHRQPFEIRERRQAAAEVVQGEAATEIFQGVDKTQGVVQIGDGGGFGDLEAEFLVERLPVRQAPHQIVQQLVVAQRMAGQVDRAQRQLVEMVRVEG